MAGLARWINGSIRYSPGTIGGIKIDGTAFHHGGHYPAYSMPGYASIGEYLRLVQDTSFGLNVEARQILKFALLSLSKQTNLRDWGIGASGRHPFEGNINKKCVLTYAYAAQAFDPIDKELAGEFLRLSEGLKQYSLERKLIRFFEKNEIKKNDYPKGFHVYNYASQGIYRYGKNMVSLKGFTTNIWGSEIYTADNRYGRYQSYGSVQIIGSMNTHPVNDAFFITEQASRYKQEGWDWNRNPGVTSIHLPFDSLDSPFKHSLMLRQTERFSGASNFENGEYGMFAMKLGEKQYSNFTPSFKAHKSVFCFDGKIICLGSNISNRNSEYPTETILFQQALFSQNESIKINNETITAYPYSRKISDSENTPTILKDLTGQHYYIPEGQNINIVKQSQQSRHNKTKEITNGDFASAYFEHGESPENAQYEYMILLDATSEKISNLYKKETGYEVILKNQNAHIVQDKDSRVRAYAVFNDFTSNNDPFILKCTEETMIMLRREKNKLKISVCDPDLNLGEYRYTTSNSSGMKRKYILLKGKYRLIEENEAVRIRHEENNTSVEIKCQHGIPVEFQLIETP